MTGQAVLQILHFMQLSNDCLMGCWVVCMLLHRIASQIVAWNELLGEQSTYSESGSDSYTFERAFSDHITLAKLRSGYV